MKKFITFSLLILIASHLSYGQKKVENIIDTFKLNPAAKVKDVKICKVQDSVTITAEDGSFVIKWGKIYEPKFFTPGWVNPDKDFTKSFINSGGKKVKIRYKSHKKEYYGILEFNQVYEACAGDAAARSYFININDKAIRDASGGNTTVIYESYYCIPREGDKSLKDYTAKKTRYTSWVLWLSDIPFE